MASLRCTSCGRLYNRVDAVRSGFKCPRCGGLALFDWSEGQERVEAPEGSLLGRVRRRLRRGARA